MVVEIAQIDVDNFFYLATGVLDFQVAVIYMLHHLGVEEVVPDAFKGVFV